MVWGNRKPPPGTPINWDHPLAQGLVAYFPFNEGAGKTAYDVVGPESFAVPPFVGSGATDSWVYPYYSSGGNPNYSQSGAFPARWKINPPLSLIWMGEFTGTPTTNATIFGGLYSSPNGSPFRCWTFETDAGNGYVFDCNSAGTGIGFTYSLSVASGAPVQLCGVISPTKIDGTNYGVAYKDCKPVVGYSTAAISAVNYTATSCIQFGYCGSQRNHMAAIYSRVLTASDQNWLRTEPFALFADRRRNSSLFSLVHVPQAFSKSASDSATFTTAIVGHVAYPVAASTSATFTDKASSAGRASSSATFSDVASEHHAAVVSVSQSATFNMTAVASRNAVASATGAALFSDEASEIAKFKRGASDSATFSMVVGRAWQKSASTSATFSDAAGKNIAHIRSASDSATFFTMATLNGHVVFAVDSAKFTDAAEGRVRHFLPVGASDRATFSMRAGSRVFTVDVSSPDVMIFTDLAEATRVIIRAASDSFIFTDIARAVRAFHKSASDSFKFTDLARSNHFYHKSASDSFIFTDLAVAQRLKLGASDLMIFSDLAVAVASLPDNINGLNHVLFSPVSPEWPFTYAESAEGLIMVANGIDPVLAWDGLADKAWTAGIAPPSSAVILSGSLAGLLTGRRYAFVRFVDNRGNVSNLSQWSDYVDLGTDGFVQNVKYDSNGVTTVWSRAHGLVTGNTVIIRGVDANDPHGVPIANGIWTITVVDENSFILQGLHVNAGHYKAGGIWTHGSAVINYSSVPTSADHKVARRQILRNLEGNTNVFYVDIDTTNLAGTNFSSSRTDESLAAQEPVVLQFDDKEPSSQRFYPPPSHKKAIAAYAGRIWLAADAVYKTGNVQVSLGSQVVRGIGTSWTANMAGRLLYVVTATQAQPIQQINVTQQTAILETPFKGHSAQFASYAIRPAPIERRLVYFSEPNLNEAWPPWNAFAVPESSDEITGIFVLKSYLFIIKERHIYKFTYREDPARDGFVWPVAGRGCVNDRSYALVEGVAYLLDEMGIYAFDGEKVDPVSTAVQAIFKPDGSSPYRIDWTTDRRFWSCVHDPSMEIVRWWVDFVDQPPLSFAVCWNYRNNQWWLEQFPEAVSSSALAVVSGYRQSVVGTTGRRVFCLGQGTLDAIKEDAIGTLRGTATDATPLTISDVNARFPLGTAGVPVIIASGTGAGQAGIISSNTDTTLTLVDPLPITPDASSVYQIGGVAWTWKSGWRKLADDEAENPRDLEWVWKPTENEASMNGKVFYDHGPEPTTWAMDWNTDGISVINGDSNLTIDLSQPRGYGIHRLAGHRDPYGFGHRHLAVALHGVQAIDPHRIFHLAISGAE